MMSIEENALLRECIERGHLLGRHRIAPQSIHDHDHNVLRRSGNRREFLGGALSAAGQERDQEGSDELQWLHGGMIQTMTKLSGAKFDQFVRHARPRASGLTAFERRIQCLKPWTK